MSDCWFDDMHRMHAHYGFHEWVARLDADGLARLLQFRTNFLQEELDELATADCADEVVDALVDLIVVASGTLDLFGVDQRVAWERVLAANLNKHVGVKEGREQTGDMPDLVKDPGWVPPTHEDNVGTLARLFE